MGDCARAFKQRLRLVTIAAARPAERRSGTVTSLLKRSQQVAVTKHHCNESTQQSRTCLVIEIEVQNETHQDVHRIKVMNVPRIGEGIRLREPSGQWASYDILDVWYQQAEYGEVWVPYIHVRMTPDEMQTAEMARVNPLVDKGQQVPIEDFLKKFEGDHEHETVKLNLDMSEDV